MRAPPLAETAEYEKVFEIAHPAVPARPPEYVPPLIVPKLKLRVIVADEPPSQYPATPPTVPVPVPIAPVFHTPSSPTAVPEFPLMNPTIPPTWLVQEPWLIDPELLDVSIRDSHNCPAIPPARQLDVLPVEVTEPELVDKVILQLDPPRFGSKAPVIPPRYADPVTEPLNELFDANGRALAHDVF